jgi:hypothetical protein
VYSTDRPALPGRLVRAHLQNLEENATRAQEFGGRDGPWQYLATGIGLQMSYVEIPLLIGFSRGLHYTTCFIGNITHSRDVI